MKGNRVKNIIIVLFVAILLVGCDGKRGYDGITGPTGEAEDGRAGTDGCDFGEMKDYDTGECVPDIMFTPFDPDDLCYYPNTWDYDAGHCYYSNNPNDPHNPTP